MAQHADAATTSNASQGRNEDNENDSSTIPGTDYENDTLWWLVYHWRWDEAKARVDSHPLEARVKKYDGTPLHLACLRFAPPELLAALLRAFPGGASDIVKRYGMDGRHQAKDGYTPLELLCTEYSDDMQDKPIWQLDGDDRDGDSRGSYPYYFRDEPAKQPARVWAAASLLVGESAAALWRQAAVSTVDDPTPSTQLVSVPLLPSVEQSISTRCCGRHREEALFEAAKLHCPGRIPRNVIKWIAACRYPDLLRPPEEADARGDLALHRFAADVSATDPGAEFRSTVDLHRLVGRMFLSMHPRAARVPNGDGRLPLHLAASVGGGAGRGILGLLGDILMVFPLALGVADPVTGLLPFMIPAVGDVGNAGASDNCNLDAIFMLLREDPDKVRSGIKVETQQNLDGQTDDSDPLPPLA